jgi:hypothetical protein
MGNPPGLRLTASAVAEEPTPQGARTLRVERGSWGGFASLGTALAAAAPYVRELRGWDPSLGTVTWNRVHTFDLKPYVEHVIKKVPRLGDLVHARIAAAQAVEDQKMAVREQHDAEIRALLDSLRKSEPDP